MCGLLVLDPLDLMSNLLELFPLRSEEFLAPPRASLCAVDLFGKMLLELILILAFGTQQASIEDVGLRAIEGDGWMDFPQVDPRAVLCLTLWLVEFVVLWPIRAAQAISSNGLVLLARP